MIKVTDKEGFVKYYTIDVVKEASKTATSNSTLFGLTPLQFGFIVRIIKFNITINNSNNSFILVKRKSKNQKSHQL